MLLVQERVFQSLLFPIRISTVIFRSAEEHQLIFSEIQKLRDDFFVLIIGQGFWAASDSWEFEVFEAVGVVRVFGERGVAGLVWIGFIDLLFAGRWGGIDGDIVFVVLVDFL